MNSEPWVAAPAAQRKNILKAAFAGQLVPQDPNDEPASALLDRIRAGRVSGSASRSNKAGRKLGTGMSNDTGGLILYRTEDGRADIQLHAVDGTVWLTQADMADLFETSKQNISLHVRKVLAEGELSESAVVKFDLTTASDGKRYKTMLYRLDMILAVGFRVRSPRGNQFRRWAGTVLAEFLVKGFAMNDARLKDAERADYFEELLARIRDIRSSEKRFYQKLRDLFKASSSDYDGTAQTAKTFFATIQNKLVFAVTGQTAAELIVARADPAADNMALTNWPGARIRKADVVVSKNYLQADELDQLNRLVTMFLDFAEDRAIRRIETRMGEWIAQTDRFLSFNERSILGGAGRVSHERMESILIERFAEFDVRRREQEQRTADREAADDLTQLESAAARLVPHKKTKGPKKP